MPRPSLTEHGLRVAVAILASLVVAPAAGAEDGLPVVPDPVAMTASLVDASLTSVAMPPVDVPLPVPVPTQPVPEAVAAAAEPIPAQEPQPTPPPPQPQVPDPTPARETAPEDATPSPEPAPAPVEEPQYQPEPPQYQPAETPAPDEAPPAAAPAPAEPAGQTWSWDWNWSCDDPGAPVQAPAIQGDDLPDAWAWNWTWNCDPGQTLSGNIADKSDPQYQPVITQYHLVNVNVSIRIGSPGNDGPVNQTNVIVRVEPQAIAAAARAAALVDSRAPPEPEPLAAPEPSSSTPAVAAHGPEPDRKGGPRSMLASAPQLAAPAEADSWSPPAVTPRRLQHTNLETHHNRPKPRRLSRRPVPPKRAPVIPMSPAGAAPLGGADGGGFHLALLLVPFALALVDSARRLVRDAAPPVGRGHKKRRKRPG